jgi:hypothetical protein
MSQGILTIKERKKCEKKDNVLLLPRIVGRWRSLARTKSTYHTQFL